MSGAPPLPLSAAPHFHSAPCDLLGAVASPAAFFVAAMRIETTPFQTRGAEDGELMSYHWRVVALRRGGRIKERWPLSQGKHGEISTAAFASGLPRSYLVRSPKTNGRAPPAAHRPLSRLLNALAVAVVGIGRAPG